VSGNKAVSTVPPKKKKRYLKKGKSAKVISKKLGVKKMKVYHPHEK
jgi:hypothetical protein